MEENIGNSNSAPPFNRKSCSCGKVNDEVDSCELCNFKQPIGMTGWICPICSRGNSPFVLTCPCIPFPNFQTTCKPV